jgi:hypothetical protein
MANKSGIHIKASRRGTFQAAATREGKSLSEEANDVLAPGSGASDKLRAKAQFYKNIVKK